MYILMLVTSMLMLLALLTYGRIESFRGFSFVQSQFEEYIEKTEREYSNERAIKHYKETVATPRGTNGEQEKNGASSKLSFQLFVDMPERLAHLKEFDQNVLIAKNLIYTLYGEQTFYIEMEEKRPNFVDEIFEGIIRETDLLIDPKQKLKKTKELANIDLRDPELNDVFTKMLKGTNPPEDGYESLLDFITLTKNNLTIRVFLAPRPLLMALFGSSSVVDDILFQRAELYHILSNSSGEEDYKSAGSQEFKEQFLDYRLPYVNEETLDFGISKTDPRYYN